MDLTVKTFPLKDHTTKFCMSEPESEQTGGFITVSTHHVDVSQDILTFQNLHDPLHNVTLNKNRQFGD